MVSMGGWGNGSAVRLICKNNDQNQLTTDNRQSFAFCATAVKLDIQFDCDGNADLMTTPTDKAFATELSAAIAAADAAGKILLDWSSKFTVTDKGPKNPVTEADLASQASIVTQLSSQFPEHGFAGEEDNLPAELHRPDAEFQWVIDPLDGTVNYIHQLPSYSVSIALLKQGQPVAGVVHDPVMAETYAASLGGGATLNSQPIAASQCELLDRALVVTSLPGNVQPSSPDLQSFLSILFQAQAIRRLGSAALNLCYVAAGRLDAYWAESINLWDVAAGVLILQEAGGTVRHIDDKHFDPQDPRLIGTATPALWQAMKQAVDDGSRYRLHVDG